MNALNQIVHNLPWVMSQRWEHLMFAHWQVPVDALRKLVPPQLELDTFEGQAWISVVPMKMGDIHFRGLSLPIKSIFPQVNVRTYVTVDGKRGIYFLTIDAPRPTAVYTARWTYRLNYCMADTVMEVGEREIRLQNKRKHRGLPPAEIKVKFKPTSEPYEAQPETLDDWLTDRLCLYTVYPNGRVYRADIDHDPWQLRRAEAEIEYNSMLPESIAQLVDPLCPTFAQCVDQIDVQLWMPKRVR